MQLTLYNMNELEFSGGMIALAYLFEKLEFYFKPVSISLKRKKASQNSVGLIINY